MKNGLTRGGTTQTSNYTLKNSIQWLMEIDTWVFLIKNFFLFMSTSTSYVFITVSNVKAFIVQISL